MTLHASVFNFADWQLHVSAFTNFFADRQLHVSLTIWQLHASCSKFVQTDSYMQNAQSLHNFDSYMSGFQCDLVDSFDKSKNETSPRDRSIRSQLN